MAGETGHNPVLKALYPEVAVGGFTRHDGFVEFFLRVNELNPAGGTVLDFGAGRGSWTDMELASIHRRLRDLGARGAKVVGIDVDPIVLENPTLDEAHVVSPGSGLPFGDSTFDLVIADHVLEHVSASDAPGVSAEIERVLKPGGWFAARTPNKWGVIALGARLIPNAFHARVLRRLQPGREIRDIFPTRYAMNTGRSLRRLFPAETWNLTYYQHASEPQYFGHSLVAWRLAAFLDRITPPPLLPTLMVFAQKRTP